MSSTMYTPYTLLVMVDEDEQLFIVVEPHGYPRNIPGMLTLVEKVPLRRRGLSGKFSAPISGMEAFLDVIRIVTPPDSIFRDQSLRFIDSLFTFIFRQETARTHLQRITETALSVCLPDISREEGSLGIFRAFSEAIGGMTIMRLLDDGTFESLSKEVVRAVKRRQESHAA